MYTIHITHENKYHIIATELGVCPI